MGNTRSPCAVIPIGMQPPGGTPSPFASARGEFPPCDCSLVGGGDAGDGVSAGLASASFVSAVFTSACLTSGFRAAADPEVSLPALPTVGASTFAGPPNSMDPGLPAVPSEFAGGLSTLACCPETG